MSQKLSEEKDQHQKAQREKNKVTNERDAISEKLCKDKDHQQYTQLELTKITKERDTTCMELSEAKVYQQKKTFHLNKVINERDTIKNELSEAKYEIDEMMDSILISIFQQDYSKDHWKIVKQNYLKLVNYFYHLLK